MAISRMGRRGLLGSMGACGAALGAASLAFACSTNMTTATLLATPDTAGANTSPTVTLSGHGYTTTSIQLDYQAAGAAGSCHGSGGITPSNVTATPDLTGTSFSSSVTIGNTGGVGVATICAQDSNRQNGAHTPFVVS